MVWFVAWHKLVADSPEAHRHITPEEKRYIMAERPPIDTNAVSDTQKRVE